MHTEESSLEDISGNYGTLDTIMALRWINENIHHFGGDFIAAAELINSSTINFMAKYGRGLICVPMSEKLCNKLNLNKMVPNNTDPFETAFTVSVDLKGNGVTSGISASDRAKTVQALVNDKTKPEDLTRPGDRKSVV